jgi:hypothetical protein
VERSRITQFLLTRRRRIIPHRLTSNMGWMTLSSRTTTPKSSEYRNRTFFGPSSELTEQSIIAIHGLNGNRIKTWADGKTFWLRDLLPTTLKKHGTRARIWSYGYNAYSHSGAAVSIQDLWGHGGAFLAEVVSRRKRDNVRIPGWSGVCVDAELT